MHRIELLVTSAQAGLVPAANDQFTIGACALEHFSDGRFLDELWQYAERVHAHTADAERVVVPEVVAGGEYLIGDDMVQLDGVTLLEAHLAALELTEVLVQGQRCVNHGLADFHADQIFEVVSDFGEKLGGAHANFNDAASLKL